MMHRATISMLNAASRRIAEPSARAVFSSRASVSDCPPKEQLFDDTVSSKPYIPLYHHRDASLFPPLIPDSLPYLIHNATAATQALFSLAFDEELRHEFFTIAKIYGLSPQVPRSDDDSDNLYNGCILNTNVVAQSDLGFINVFSLFDGLSSPLYDKGIPFNVKEFMDGAGFALEQFHKVDRDFFLSLRNKSMENYDFLTVAKSDRDSIEYDLMNMTTPPFWSYLDRCLRQVKPVLNKIAEIGAPAKSRIVNLALLSARIAEIEKPEDNVGDETYYEEESCSTMNQIVTQLEVLYERELSPTRYGDDVSSRTNVATFEACISGDPNGEQLQWRLSQTRPASEFPYLV